MHVAAHAWKYASSVLGTRDITRRFLTHLSSAEVRAVWSGDCRTKCREKGADREKLCCLRPDNAVRTAKLRDARTRSLDALVYTFCPGKKWFLDGTRSVNPDDGKSEAGAPQDYIQQYAWDVFGGNAFTDAYGATPDVTGKWGPGSYLIQLKVTDNTALSFPSSGMSDLSSTASSQVVVKPSCNCITDLKALAKNNLVQINWTNTQADHYNVYRSTVQGGPYVLIATVSGNSLSRLGLLDKNVTNNVTYYYVVRDANLAGDEYCQSNEVKAKPVSLF